MPLPHTFSFLYIALPPIIQFLFRLLFETASLSQPFDFARRHRRHRFRSLVSFLADELSILALDYRRLLSHYFGGALVAARISLRDMLFSLDITFGIDWRKARRFASLPCQIGLTEALHFAYKLILSTRVAQSERVNHHRIYVII